MSDGNGSKRVRMGDVYASHPPTAMTTATTTTTTTGHHPSSSAYTGTTAGTTGTASRPVVQMAQLGQAGGRPSQDYANRYHHYNADLYERDGNGRNNINRFSLNAQQVSEVL